MIKRILLPALALLLALSALLPGYGAAPPAGAARARTAPRVSGCTGPMVTVYGSSALNSFVTATATDYCNYQVNVLHVAVGSAFDVELLGGGDSCPGWAFAAGQTTTANALGIADVFSSSCPTPVNPSLVADNVVNVNLVEAVTHCGGAASPQGGHPGIYGTTGGAGGSPTNSVTAANGCQGQNPSAPTCPSPQPTRTFLLPNSLNAGSAGLTWSNVVGDMNQVGGCAGTTFFRLQNRKTDSGTRITYCFNVFGGADGCQNSATCITGQSPVQAGCTNGTTPDPGCVTNGVFDPTKCPAGLAPTTGVMLDAVCGSRSTSNNGGNPYDPDGTIGYASRSGLYTSSGSPNPYPNCGLVGFNSLSGWNATCDQYALDQGAAVGSVSVPTGTTGTNNDGATECKGDLQVAKGDYPVWGYEHFVLRAGSTASGALGYLNYIKNNVTPAPTINPDFYADQQGFLRECRMNFNRLTDAGAYQLGSIVVNNGGVGC